MFISLKKRWKRGVTIPEGTSHLDLSSNSFGYAKVYHGEDLADILATIPDSVISLKLSSNNLNDAKKLNLAFNKLNRSLESLNLSHNEFGRKESGELVAALTSLPPELSDLDFSDNYLSAELDAKKLGEIFAAFPLGLKTLRLGSNFTTAITGDYLAEGLKALHSHEQLTSLYLNGNSLGHHSNIEVAFHNIPPTLTALYLSNNNLSVMGHDKLKCILQIIGQRAPKIARLDLSYNELADYYNPQDIAEVINAIPKGVTSLNLAGNNFACSHEKLMALAHNLSPELVELDLSGNALDIKSPEELIEFLLALPDSLEVVKYGEGKEFKPFLSQIKDLVALKEDKFIYNLTNIKLPFGIQINEQILEQLIKGLEEKDTSIAYFTCGLLKQHHILNVINAVEEPADKEKRIHSVISYYFKALLRATEDNIKPLINFLLWETKVVAEPGSSIERRLTFINTPADDLIATHSHFKDTKIDLGNIDKAALFKSESTFSAYQKLYQRGGPLALLRDYTKDDSSISRFFHGHWNRHHVEDVSRVLNDFDGEREYKPEELILELKSIQLANPANSSLARRILFIEYQHALELEHDEVHTDTQTTKFS